MPIYEFKCEACSHIDEHLMKISDPAPEKCTVCGGKVHKIMSKSSFSLKGTGWYATDYKNSPQNVPATENNENKSANSNETAKTAETPAEASQLQTTAKTTTSAEPNK